MSNHYYQVVTAPWSVSCVIEIVPRCSFRAQVAKDHIVPICCFLACFLLLFQVLVFQCLYYATLLGGLVGNNSTSIRQILSPVPSASAYK